MIPTATREEWRRLSEAIPPGPWTDDCAEPSDVVVWAKEDCLVFNVGPPIALVGQACAGEAETAAFIAASREAVPQLLDDNAALLALLRECRNTIKGAYLAPKLWDRSLAWKESETLISKLDSILTDGGKT